MTLNKQPILIPTVYWYTKKKYNIQYPNRHANCDVTVTEKIQFLQGKDNTKQSKEY